MYSVIKLCLKYAKFMCMMLSIVRSSYRQLHGGRSYDSM